MQVGRPPKPTVLKMLAGNPGKRKLNDQEPKPKGGEPEMPDTLNERAQKEWKRLVPMLLGMRTLTVADGLALGLICADIADLERINEAIEKSGYLIQASLGGYKLNPLLPVQVVLHRRVTEGLREFGLTPASRSRVRTVAEERPVNAFAEFA